MLPALLANYGSSPAERFKILALDQHCTSRETANFSCQDSSTWLTCEIEALSIPAATKQFSPFIIQSSKNASIFTDSKPCVQAFEKLCRGEFSASPRISTFLSVVCRYQASVRHFAGSAIVPSDFASRNAPPCDNETCQICTFVNP